MSDFCRVGDVLDVSFVCLMIPYLYDFYARCPSIEGSFGLYEDGEVQGRRKFSILLDLE